MSLLIVQASQTYRTLVVVRERERREGEWRERGRERDVPSLPKEELDLSVLGNFYCITNLPWWGRLWRRWLCCSSRELLEKWIIWTLFSQISGMGMGPKQHWVHLSMTSDKSWIGVRGCSHPSLLDFMVAFNLIDHDILLGWFWWFKEGNAVLVLFFPSVVLFCYFSVFQLIGTKTLAPALWSFLAPGLQISAGLDSLSALI